jgi:hypothetical protein
MLGVEKYVETSWRRKGMRNILEKAYGYVRRFVMQRDSLFSSSGGQRQEYYQPDRAYSAYEADRSVDSTPYRTDSRPMDYERRREEYPYDDAVRHEGYIYEQARRREEYPYQGRAYEPGSSQQEYERRLRMDEQGTEYGRQPYPANLPYGQYPDGGYVQQGGMQRRGMSPWVAGGLGALGGGLMGYGLGQTVGEMQQYADHGWGDGEGNYVDAGFGGEDFGGGDFGGE